MKCVIGVYDVECVCDEVLDDYDCVVGKSVIYDRLFIGLFFLCICLYCVGVMIKFYVVWLYIKICYLVYDIIFWIFNFVFVIDDVVEFGKFFWVKIMSCGF